MAYDDTARLFTILARHSIVVESVKSYSDGFITIPQNKLKTDLTNIFSHVKYDTLDELTKAEMRALVIKLKDILRKAYSKYTADMLDLLNSFMKADLYVQRGMMAALKFDDEDEQAEAGDELSELDSNDVEDDDESQNALIVATGVPKSKISGTPAAMWANIVNSIMPADGQTPVQLLNSFAAGSINNIVKIVQKAWINGDTPKDVLNAIIGTAKNKFTDGEFAKQVRQAATVTHTIIQHVTSTVSAGVQSVFYDCYQWVSVMDGRTSEICSSRNGRIYHYGNGPLPPAHYRCRSKVVPAPGCNGSSNPDLEDWIEDDGNDLDLGEIKNGKYFATKPLNVDGFISKISDILR